jgi:hypothetical protein
MFGLHTPQTAVLQIVEEAAPKETSTERSSVRSTLCSKINESPTAH